VTQAFLQVQRHRIIYLAADLLFLQIRQQRITAASGDSDNELIKNMATAGSLLRQENKIVKLSLPVIHAGAR
jgi:hypothetical protein